MRRISLWLVLAALAIAPVLPSRADEATDIAREEDTRTVAVGSTDPLEFDYNVGDVVVGNPSVLKAEKQGTRNVRLIPQKKGTSSVEIFNEQGKRTRRLIYNVIANEISPKVLAIRKLLSDIEGITVEMVDEKIVIDGDLVVPRDLDRIVQVASAYPEVLNLVTLSRVSREALARRMQKEINDDPGGVNVTVRIINDTFFLLGKVDNTRDSDRAETLAKTYLPEILKGSAGDLLAAGAKKFSFQNLIVVEEPPAPPPPKMVRITYHFVEIGKDFLKSSFFKWNPLLSDNSGLQIGESTTGGAAAAGTFSGLISNLLPKLQSGANGGFSRVLFSTVSIGEDKVQQEVIRNDTQPYISAVVNGIPVPDNVQAQISVKVKPEIIGEDQVRMESTFNFTAFSGAGAGGKPRTTGTNMINTVRVKTGDSAVLGGLISNQTAKDLDKDPEASSGSSGSGSQQQGSSIFTLLRSKAFRAAKTQFVVFVTPKILEDAASGTADIKAKILNNSQKKRRRVVN